MIFGRNSNSRKILDRNLPLEKIFHLKFLCWIIKSIHPKFKFLTDNVFFMEIFLSIFFKISYFPTKILLETLSQNILTELSSRNELTELFYLFLEHYPIANFNKKFH